MAVMNGRISTAPRAQLSPILEEERQRGTTKHGGNDKKYICICIQCIQITIVTCINTQVYTHTYIHIHTHTHTHAHTHTRTHTHTSKLNYTSFYSIVP